MRPDERESRPVDDRPARATQPELDDRASVTDRANVVVPFPRRYGEPSDFGLSPAGLAAEIRRCRRSGWFRWECLVRFGRAS